MIATARKLDALTGLRFLLAIWVVIYHQIPLSQDAGISWWPGAPSLLVLILRCGYVAVTGFFLLSGFVLSYNYPADELWPNARKGKFWIARLSRIYPAYLAGLLLMLPLFLYRSTKVADGAGYLREQAQAGVLNVLLLQAWWPGMALTWNFPGWSLSDEAFFYVSFPLLAWLLSKIPRNASLVLAWLAAFWALSLLPPVWAIALGLPGGQDVAASYAVLGEDLWIQLVRYWPPARLMEFAMGAVLGQYYRRRIEDKVAPVAGSAIWPLLGVTGLVGVLAAAAVIPHPLMHNSLLAPLFAMLIIGLAGGGGWTGTFLSARPLVFLGSASYAMYILHSPLESYLGILWKGLGSGPPGTPIWVATYVVTVIVVSSLFHVVFEEPAHRALRAALERCLDRWIN